MNTGAAPRREPSSMAADRDGDEAVIEAVERTNNLKLATQLAGVARSWVYERLENEPGFRSRIEAARRKFREQSTASRLDRVRRRLRRPDLD